MASHRRKQQQQQGGDSENGGGGSNMNENSGDTGERGAVYDIPGQ
jgi:hypothetical protein